MGGQGGVGVWDGGDEGLGRVGVKMRYVGVWGGHNHCGISLVELVSPTSIRGTCFPRENVFENIWSD